MSFVEIDIKKEKINPFEMIGDRWFLVTAGNKDNFNTMTASWGMMGVMWGKSCVTTVIRPQRYTKKFIDTNEYFTFSFFGEEFKKALGFCGSHSGKDVDKMKETGLVPVETDGTVSFEQAEIVLVCRKLYAQEMKEECFVDAAIPESCYQAGDFHTAYVGEIVKAYVNK